ncbi:hypothetical protein BLNAU_2066 [Blattamonas nauphoetae]|uniref:Uncharacterized protein n=1 Tax=Blattamonas nauphoetae TaxID=2049346 RepID=A0ABQ9YH01_9EUKA|nr:hypothetical protein BLNAU_2066 [Blattamonas nauphoetae]
MWLREHRTGLLGNSTGLTMELKSDAEEEDALRTPRLDRMSNQVTSDSLDHASGSVNTTPTTRQGRMLDEHRQNDIEIGTDVDYVSAFEYFHRLTQ